MKRRVLTVMLSLAVTITSVPSTVFVSAEAFTDGQAAEVAAAPEEVVVEDAAAFQAEAAAPEEAAETEIPAETEPVIADGEEFLIDAPETEEISLDVPEAVVPTAEEVPEDMPEFGAEVEADVPELMADAKTLDKVTVTIALTEGAKTTEELTDFSSDGMKTSTSVKLTYDPAKGTNQGQGIEIKEIRYDKEDTNILIPEDAYEVKQRNCEKAATSGDAVAPQFSIRFTDPEWEVLGQIIVKFAIDKATITADRITVTYDGKPAEGKEETDMWKTPYNGEDQYPKNLSVMLDGKYELKETTDYTKTVTDPKNASDSAKELKIQAAGNYNAVGDLATIKYKIEKIDAKGAVGCGSWEEVPGLVITKKNGEDDNTYTAGLKSAIEETVKDLKDTTGTIQNSEYDIKYYGTGTLESDVDVTGTDAKVMAPGIHKYRIVMNGTCKNFKEGSFVEGYYRVYGGETIKNIYESLNKASDGAKGGIDQEIEKVNGYTGEDKTSDIGTAITTKLDEYKSTDSNFGHEKLRVRCISAEKAIECGTYTFRIEGVPGQSWEGDYYDVQIPVVPRNMQNVTANGFLDGISATATQRYCVDGSFEAPVITVTDSGNKEKAVTDNSNKLVEGTHYTVTSDYDPSKRNKITKITVTGINNYTTKDMTAAALKENPNGKDAPVEQTISGISEEIDLSDESIKAKVKTTYTYGVSNIWLRSDDIEVQQEITGKGLVTLDPENYVVDKIDDKDRATFTTSGVLAAGKHIVTIKGDPNGAVKIKEGTTTTAELNVIGTEFSKYYELVEKDITATVDVETTCPDPGVKIKGESGTLPNTNYKLSYWCMVEEENETTHEKEKVKKYLDAGGELKKEDERTADSYFAPTATVTFKNVGEWNLEITPDTSIGLMSSYDGMLGPKKFEVKQKSLEDETLKFTVTDSGNFVVAWPGHPVEGKDLTGLELKENGTKVNEKDGEVVNYTVKVENNDQIGLAKIVVTGEGKYSGSIEKDLQITKKSINGGSITYTGKIPACDDITNALKPADIEVKTSDSQTVETNEYTVICVASSDGKKATIKVTAVPDGHYEGVIVNSSETDIESTANIENTNSFTLDVAPIVYYYETDGEVAGQQQSSLILTDTRTGKKLVGAPKVAGAPAADPSTTVKPDYDYTYSYEGIEGIANSDVVIATVTLEGVSGKKSQSEADVVGYTGKRTATYTVTLPSLAEVKLAEGKHTYTGEPILPDVVEVTDINGKVVPAEVYEGEVSGKDNINAGTAASVVVSAKKDSGYIGSAAATFEIAKAQNTIVVPASLEVPVGESLKLSASANEAAKMHFELKSGTAVSVAEDGTLKGLAAGSAEVLVKADATDNYEAAQTTVAVKVVPAVSTKDIAKYTVTLKETSFVYNGKAQTPEVVSVTNGTETLKEGTDYIVSYVNNVNAGEATVNVNGQGTYYGTASAKFTIKKDKNEVSAPAVVERAFKAAGRTFTLEAFAAYEKAALTYKSDSSEVKVNSTSGKVTVPKNFTGVANITVTAAETLNYESVSKTVKVEILPSKTEITRLSQNGTKIRVQYKKNSVGDAFQIQYSKTKDFEKIEGSTFVHNPKCLTKSVGSKLKGVYYVRVRVLKFVDGTMANGAKNRLYSPWSAPVKKTMK